jgi:hypothetical protein
LIFRNGEEKLLKKKRRPTRRRIFSNNIRRSRVIQKESKDNKNMIITIPFNQGEERTNLKNKKSKEKVTSNQSIPDVDKMNIVKFDDFILYEQICSESEDELDKSRPDQDEEEPIFKHKLFSTEKDDSLKEDQSIFNSKIEGQPHDYYSSLVNYVENFYYRKNKINNVHKKCVLCKFSNFKPKRLLRFKSPNDLVDYYKLCLLTRDNLCTNKDNFEKNKNEVLSYDAKWDIDYLGLPSMISDLNPSTSKKYFQKSKNICRNCFRCLLNNCSGLVLIKRIIKNQEASLNKKLIFDSDKDHGMDSIVEPIDELKQVKEIKFLPTNLNNQSQNKNNDNFNENILLHNTKFINDDNKTISTNFNLQHLNSSSTLNTLSSTEKLLNNLNLNSGFQTNPLVNNLMNLSSLNNLNSFTGLIQNNINNFPNNIFTNNSNSNNLNLLSLINGFGGANLNLNSNPINPVNSLNSLYSNLTLRMVAQNLMIKNQIIGLLNNNQQIQNNQQNFQNVPQAQNSQQSQPIQQIQPTQINQSTININNVNNFNVPEEKESINPNNLIINNNETEQQVNIKEDQKISEEIDHESEFNSIKSLPLINNNSQSQSNNTIDVSIEKKNIFDKILAKKNPQNLASENLFDKLMVDTFSKEAVQSHLFKNNIIFEKIINGRDYKDNKFINESNYAPDAGLFFINKEEIIEEGLHLIKNNQNEIEAQIIKNNLMPVHETKLEIEKAENFDNFQFNQNNNSLSDVISELRDISNFLSGLSSNQVENGPIESSEPSWNVTKKILSDLNKKINEVILSRLDKIKANENKIKINLLKYNENFSLLSNKITNLNRNVDVLSNIVSGGFLENNNVSAILDGIKETSNSCTDLVEQMRESSNYLFY